MAEFVIRPAEERDRAFVVVNWLDSFRTMHAAGPIPMDLYWPTYREVIHRILGWPTVRAYVAHEPADDNELYGFGVFDGRALPIVHYLLTKGPFRKHGVARGLMAAGGIDPAKPFLFTFKTPVGATICKERWFGGRWDPLAARFRPKKENP